MRSEICSAALGLSLLALSPLVPQAPAGDSSAKLLASDGATNDQFGFAVSIGQAVAIVGSPFDDDSGADSGAAYLYEKGTNQELFKLVAADGAQGDRFGYSVAVSGTTAIVGASRADANGENSGAAYLFDTTTGQQLFKLLPDNGAEGDEFGFSVAINGTTAIVGAKGDALGVDSGSAYLFDTTTGAQLHALLPDDGAPADFFGSAVAISGTTAVVAAYRDDDHGTDSGAAYLFDVTTGQQLFKLTSATSTDFDGFGWSVAIHDTLAIVGALRDDAGSGNAGAAYLFDATNGEQVGRLLPHDPGLEDSFGYSVAISDTVAVVGAPFDNDGAPDTGSVYLYHTATLTQVAKLRPSEVQAFDSFGFSVSIHGTDVLAGAVYDGDNGVGSGSAYFQDATHTITVPYCFGSGSGTPCPCGNAGIEGHGCANSFWSHGARLWSTGTPCVGDDDLVLRVERSRPSQSGIFFQASQALNGGLGVVFGDGLRCAGVNVLRIEAAVSNVAGVVNSTVALAAASGATAGETRYFQWWYRDPGGTLCGSGFNLSSGLEVIWGP